MESKTEGTMRKSIENWCQKIVYILLGVIIQKNKQCRTDVNVNLIKIGDNCIYVVAFSHILRRLLKDTGWLIGRVGTITI